MNALELKNDIHKYVVETDDLMVLQRVKDLFRELTNESVKLSDYEKNMIERGLKDHEEGRVSTNEEVKARFNEWVKKHS